MDKIIVYAKDNDKITNIFKTNRDEMMSEVLAVDIVLGTTEGYEKEWSINGEQVVLGVKKDH